MFDLSKAVLDALGGRPVVIVPCTVTAVTPLTVTINDVSMAGVKLAGPTYSVGDAVALWAPPSTPIILPTT